MRGPREPALPLTPRQVAELAALAEDGAVPAPLSRRARQVLAVARPDGAGPEDVRPARRWLHRYLDEGPAGLADRPRSGRPRTSPAVESSGERAARAAAQERSARAHRELLTAPLLMPSPTWSSRAIADAVGVTQSAVSRAWRRAYAGPRDPWGPPWPDAGLALVGCAVSASNSVLLLAGPSRGVAPLPAVEADTMRSVRRRPVQALLAADLYAAGRAGADPAADAELVARTRRRLGDSRRLYLLTRKPLMEKASGSPEGSASPGSVVERVVATDDEWQALLRPIVRCCTACAPATLLALQHALMEWARGSAPRFEWTDAAASDRARPPVPPTSRPPGGVAPRATAHVVADQAFALLIERIISGRLSPGDRVTEASLARALRTSRTHARDALRTLASNNLLELEPHRGAVVPVPAAAHVIETYAARRALGTLLIRRAVHWTPGDLDPVERALDRLLETARTNDSYATGDADLALQDTLADATRMARIAPMFRTLTAQLRLYIALLGLNYSYPIPDMCQDDVELLAAIRHRRENDAVRLWNTKIDNALRVMTSQLRRHRADP